MISQIKRNTLPPPRLGNERLRLRRAHFFEPQCLLCALCKTRTLLARHPLAVLAWQWANRRMWALSSARFIAHLCKLGVMITYKTKVLLTCRIPYVEMIDKLVYNKLIAGGTGCQIRTVESIKCVLNKSSSE
jgi:hypothetical protein